MQNSLIKENKHNGPKNKAESRGEEKFPFQEYRLVPVEEWDDKPGSEGEIDLIKLGRHIWDRRWFVGKVTAVFLLIGLAVSLLSRTEFESTSTLLVEEDPQGEVNQLMQQFGFGGMSNNNDSETLPPGIYPEIIKSLPFQMNLIGKNITFSEPDTVMNTFTYFNAFYQPSGFDHLYNFTLGLPWTVKGWLFEEETGNIENYSSSLNFEQSSNEVYNVGGDTLKAINELKKRVTVTSSGGELEIVVEMPDPAAAAQVGQNTIELLKDYIKGYKTKKAKEDLIYAQNLLSEAEKEFELVQERLAEFKDRNMNLATATAQIREQQLQSEYELAFGVYNSLATKVENLKLRVQEETPSFTIIHPFEVPGSPSEPNSKLIIFLSLFMGVFVGLSVVIGRMVWNNVL